MSDASPTSHGTVSQWRGVSIVPRRTMPNHTIPNHKAPVSQPLLVEGTSWGMPSEQLWRQAGASTHEEIMTPTHTLPSFGQT